MNNNDIKQIAMKQSAIDLNCNFEDFLQLNNKVVISQRNDKSKNYYELPHFCQLVCYGNSLVASVDKRIENFMNSFVDKYLGFRCFDMPQLNILSKELNKYNKQVGMIAEYYLPDITINRNVEPNFDFMILKEDEITRLYDDKRFPMALSYSCDSERRDMIAVAAYKNSEIIGVAAASNDCDTMWQVGIDVTYDYRRKGVAATITKIVTNEILKLGIVPFYGTAWSNVASKNTAICSGYKAAWVELAATDDKIDINKPL